MTRPFLAFCLLFISTPAFSQEGPPTLSAPNPTAVPKDSSEPATTHSPKTNSQVAPKTLSESVLRDLIQQTNEHLEQENRPRLTELEIQELSNIIDGWSTPVSTSVFLYLMVFSAILGHSFMNKHYKWCAGMILFAAFASALAWLPPISYTRRHIFSGVFAQQLPVVLIQILPTFVWWAALADIGHWFERIAIARGLG